MLGGGSKNQQEQGALGGPGSKKPLLGACLEIHVASPEERSPFSCFALFGVPFILYEPTKCIVFCWGPHSSQGEALP